jgi:hypothetical protein
MEQVQIKKQLEEPDFIGLLPNETKNREHSRIWRNATRWSYDSYDDKVLDHHLFFKADPL